MFGGTIHRPDFIFFGVGNKTMMWEEMNNEICILSILWGKAGKTENWR